MSEEGLLKILKKIVMDLGNTVLIDRYLYLVKELDSNEKKASYLLELAKVLREQGNKTQLMMDKTLKKAMEYANTKKIKNVIIIGDEEVSSQKIKIKNMDTGKEKELFLKDL